MTERSGLKLTKWPFYLGDLLLLIAALWIANRQLPLGAWPLLLLVLCVGAGAGLCVAPFLLEYRAALKLAEADMLTTTVAEINQLHALADQIRLATAQWQTVQEHCAKTVGVSQEVSERVAAEAQAFAEFMQKANDAEKSHLRLETEKLRRAEGEWLQIVVRLLDHVHALHQAGMRSGQPSLREQLSHFQNACREIARRVGLVPFEANGDDLFDEKVHQLIEPDGQPPTQARVAETVAAGYTFQGQLLRRSLVRVKSPAVQPDPEQEPQLGLEPES